MKIIGITGNIASGKSTVSKIIADYFNFPLINVDDFSKNWIKTYELGVRSLFKRFDIPEVGTVQDTLKAYFFKHEKLKNILETGVSDDFWDYISVLGDTEIYNTIIIEHPLMFERGATEFFDYIIGVDANYTVRLDRMQKRGYTPETIYERVNAQKSLEYNKDKLDLLIDTSTYPTNEQIIQQIQNSRSFKDLLSSTSVS